MAPPRVEPYLLSSFLYNLNYAVLNLQLFFALGQADDPSRHHVPRATVTFLAAMVACRSFRLRRSTGNTIRARRHPYEADDAPEPSRIAAAREHAPDPAIAMVAFHRMGPTIRYDFSHQLNEPCHDFVRQVRYSRYTYLANASLSSTISLLRVIF